MLELSFVSAAAFIVPGSALTWTPITAGTEYAVVRLETEPTVGDGRLHVVRIDPRKARLVAHAQRTTDKVLMNGAAWAKQAGLAVVINAGMFEEDYRTHTGYFRVGKHENNPTWRKDYKAVLAFGPRKAGLAPAVIVDRDVTPGFSFADYAAVIQNLRLIKGPGRNVWKENNKRWSEAAVGMDKQGRVLFLFYRSPLSMYQFNQKILNTTLEVEKLMHMEGGPEATLSIHGGGLHLDLAGSFETGFRPDDTNDRQWDLPNVIGVVAK